MPTPRLPRRLTAAEASKRRGNERRLLAVVEEAGATLAALTREAQIAESRRADAMRDAILAGTEPAQVTVDTPDPAEVEGAPRDYEVAVEALAIFVGRSLETVEAAAPAIEEGVTERLQLAEAKRQETRRLFGEQTGSRHRPVFVAHLSAARRPICATTSVWVRRVW